MSSILSNIGQRISSGLRRLVATADEQPVAGNVLEPLPDIAIELPPMGTPLDSDEYNHGAVCSYLQNLAQESSEDAREFLDQAEENAEYFEHGDSPEPDEDQVVSNEVQNSTIAITDLQTREVPKCILEPVETGEPPVYFWAGPTLEPQPVVDPATGQQAIDPMTGEAVTAPAPYGLTPDQCGEWDIGNGPQPRNPLSIDQGEMIDDAILAGAEKARNLFKLDDTTARDKLQRVFDVFWSRSKTKYKIRRNVLTTNVEGYTVWLYEWDRYEKKHIIRPLSLRQVYLDKTAEDLDDMVFAGMDYYLDARRALRLFPQFADDIRERARKGSVAAPPGASNSVPSAFEGNFNRPTVVLRVFWLRDEPVPMEAQEAIDAGRLEERMVPGDVNPETLQPVMRRALFSGEDEVQPGSPLWPVRFCIRQITVYPESNIVLEDKECEYADIPLVHNVAIPVLHTPYGQGEPQRLKRMQKGHTKALTAIVDFMRWFAHPLTAMPRSMLNAIKDEYGDARMTAGRTLIVPDDLWQMYGGKVDSVYQAPPMSDGLVKAQQILQQGMRDDSGYTNVLRGVETGRLSGVAIGRLQEAGASQIGFKSENTASMMERLVRLELDVLVRFLTEDDVAKIISDVPRELIPYLMEKWRQMEWNVYVIVASGTGELIRARKEDARADLQIGAIDMQTFREKAQIDHESVEKRMQRQVKAQAAAAAAMPQPAGPQSEEKRDGQQ